MKSIIIISSVLLLSSLLPSSQGFTQEMGQISVQAIAESARASGQLVAATSKKKPTKRRRRSSKSSSRAATKVDLKEALRLANSGKYQEASVQLFSLSRSPRYAAERMRIKYILGIVLMEMKMHQAAAFQFVDVVRGGNPSQVRKSLEKLSQAADYLGDDSMLRYAIGKVQITQFPQSQQDMVYYRLGQFWMQKKNFAEAASAYSKVSSSSPVYSSAKYDEALSYSELNQTEKAIGIFDELIFSRREKRVTDTARVAAIIGKARAYYQQKDWDRAIETYREVPRDTDLWHDALFESSWAMLRGARFRSALSNFQSLHSDYYSDFYLPESLLLRGMVYLYICQYDEMEKVITLFKKVYAPIYNQLVRYLKSHSDPVLYFREIAAMNGEYDLLANNNDARKKYGIPFLVARKVLREGDFRRIYRYYQKLSAEQKRVESMPSSWKNSSLGVVARKILRTRMTNSERAMGRITRSHMRWVVADLRDLNEQNEFLTFEMLNGKKQAIKKTIAGKGQEKDGQIDAGADRDFYVQNGYQYWPFQGEYWLDEVGNYHYLGVQSCE